MKEIIGQAIRSALTAVKQQFPDLALPDRVDIENTRDAKHGDYTANIAFNLAKVLKQNPRSFAQTVVDALEVPPQVSKVEIAGPGFINFFVDNQYFQNLIPEILQKTSNFGKSHFGGGKKVIFEFVSANPNGPLHVGHGRSAAYGDTIANIADAIGFKVHREYYVNDAGRQMNILATSVWLRYIELFHGKFVFPTNGYVGEYVIPIAQKLADSHGKRFVHDLDSIFKDLPQDEPQGGDKEIYIDALIQRAQTLLGMADFELIHTHGLTYILEDIRQDLAEFRINYDCWFSEKELFKQGAMEQGIERLKASGKTYEKDGALWFASTAFGDDQDRVLVRANGQPTYFAPDVAYHVNKIDRGFDQIIDVFGADHHGYVARMRAALQALGKDANSFKVLLVQFAVLYRHGEKVQMSTRSGKFVTLRELREEVGVDATRFFYVMRKNDQHMDFDLELAKSQTNENPVYYIQYAHARVSAVLRQASEKQMALDEKLGIASLHCLTLPEELSLLKTLSRYPEVLLAAGKHFEPHLLAYYLRDLALDFHSYYNAHPFLVIEENIRNARICLIRAAAQIIANGLQLLGVSAPTYM